MTTKQQSILSKQLEINSLEMQVEDVNNQLDKLEEKSMSLSSRIIMAKRQLLTLKGTE